METREVARSDKGQKYLLVQLGMLRPAGERSHSLPFSRSVRCPAPASERGFLFVSIVIEMGRYLCPLDGTSNDAAWYEPSIYAAWYEPSIYAAWRAQCLRRLARAQYLRRLGYNALFSLIIL